MSRLHKLRYAVIFLLFSAVAAGQVLYQTGFEAPTYATGALSGQDTWNAPPTIVVENTLNNGGAQGVTVTPVGVASILASRSISNYSVATNGNLVRIKIDAFLSSTGNASNWNPIVATGGAQSLLAQILVVFGTTARLSLGGSMVGSVAVTRGAWNTYELDLDMTAQTATAFVNGTQIGSGTVANPGIVFNEVEFGLNSLPGTDTGTFDNLVITTPNAPPAPPGSSVPALSDLGLAGLASLLMVSALFLMRRRAAV